MHISASDLLEKYNLVDFISLDMIEKLHSSIVNNKADLAICDIKIVDEEGKQIPIKEEIQIDIAMAIDEFDFFS